MLKIALIEAGHWHAPLYLPGLSGAGGNIVAVSDQQNAFGRALAEQCGAAFYRSTAELLRDESIDFAFAFGRPVDMPRIAERLLTAGIPFALEKPCASELDALERLQAQAQASNAFVAVPYIYRVGELRQAFADVEGQLPSSFRHMSFRFIGGPPQRYITSGCEWMLDPHLSGGGCAINLGGHFVDLFRLLSGQEVESVNAIHSNASHSLAVEDYSVMTLQGSTGAVAVVETGYTFPSASDAPREFTFTARSEDYYYRSSANGIAVRSIACPDAGAREIKLELNNDHYYPMFVRDTLERFRRGEQPACGLAEAVAVMRVIESAYR